MWKLSGILFLAEAFGGRGEKVEGGEWGGGRRSYFVKFVEFFFDSGSETGQWMGLREDEGSGGGRGEETEEREEGRRREREGGRRSRCPMCSFRLGLGGSRYLRGQGRYPARGGEGGRGEEEG
jgi:hypothetical protein